MSDLIAERKALTDLIKRETTLTEKLTKDELLQTVIESTINISKSTQFMLALKTRLKIDDEEINSVLAFCLLRDFSKDKILLLTRALEKPYPKFEPRGGATTLTRPPDFGKHVEGT